MFNSKPRKRLLDTNANGRMLILAALTGIFLIAALLAATYQVVPIHGNSMNPALHDGDVVVLRLWGSGPDVGNMIVFTRDEEPETKMTKRVAAAAGQTKVSYNNQAWRLGPNDFWVTGYYHHWDDPRMIYDSAYYGPVQRHEIQGVIIESSDILSWLWKHRDVRNPEAGDRQ